MLLVMQNLTNSFLTRHLCKLSLRERNDHNYDLLSFVAPRKKETKFTISPDPCSAKHSLGRLYAAFL